MKDDYNPYRASRRYDPETVWYDSFAVGGRVQWIIFKGDRKLAVVQNEQQCKNILEICDREDTA